MKKSAFFSVAVFSIFVLCFSSCKMVSGEKYDQEVSKNDSLLIVALQQSNEIAELSSTMYSISSKLDEINGEIALGNDDNNLVKQRQRLMDQLQKVQDKINQKQEELDALQKKYSSVLSSNKELNKTITRLKGDIENYTNKISSYENVVKEQSKKIETLSTDLTTTQQNLEEKVKENEQQQEVITVQDQMLNEVYYIIASKSKLKELGLVDGGVFSKARLTRGTFDMSAFTKIDIREVSEIELNSKDAKILSSAPESSYEIVKGYDKMLKLVIKDPGAFWSQSKYLVIKI